MISNLLLQQILYHPEQFPPRHRTRRGMPNPALLPKHGDLPVLLKQETISAANLEFLRTQAAEPHLGRFLLPLCGGFVENELLELPGKDDPRELERMHDQVGAAGQFEFLAHTVELSTTRRNVETRIMRHIIIEARN